MFFKKDKNFEELKTNIAKQTLLGMHKTFEHIKKAEQCLNNADKKEQDVNNKYLDINYKLNNYIKNQTGEF